MQNIYIVQIDDNKEHCERLKTLAWRLGSKRDWNVEVSDFQSLEEGYDEFGREIKYKALILDAKCVISKGENEDMEFLPVALRRLEELNQKTGRGFTPFVVNTGFATFPEITSQQRNIEDLNGKIYDKSDEENMLMFLFDAIQNAENTKIEKQFSEIFEIFDKGYLDSTFRGHLLRLIKCGNSDDPTTIKTNLALIRSLQEQLFQSINRTNKRVVSDYAATPNVSFWAVHKHLSGNTVNVNRHDPTKKREFQPTTEVFQNNWIESLSECIYKITSDNGAHTPYDKTPLPNKYTVKSLTYAFLEQLLWFKGLIGS